jgi:hypothetical protein
MHVTSNRHFLTLVYSSLTDIIILKMETRGKYVFTGCAVKFALHSGNPEQIEIHELEFDYPEGPVENGGEIRTSHMAFLFERDFGWKLLSSTDNYFTFDISENIAIQTSMWYRFNILDGNGLARTIHFKLMSTHHFGTVV